MLKITMENGKEINVENSLIVFALMELKVADKKHLEFWTDHHAYLMGHESEEINNREFKDQLMDSVKHIQEYSEEIKEVTNLEEML